MVGGGEGEEVGGVIMKSPTRTICGQQVSFERRRYGDQTFTWAYVKLGDQYHSLGDPWPCLNPKSEELERDVRRFCGCPAST